MGTKSPGAPPQRCRLILQHCLAIQLSKPGHIPADDFWMYDSGYMIFQNFLAANSQCWWNAPLSAATRVLKYAGHVAPGMLLVTAEPCALEVLRGAYARSVLKPPATYVISSVGDIDDCIVTPTVQGQFTPLPEALCDIIMDLTSQGYSATIENIRTNMTMRFSHMQLPTTEIIYDSLVQLMQERKIYQTAKGYFIVTPERRRSRSRPRAANRSSLLDDHYNNIAEPSESRIMLMTNSEAVHSLYGEISTERDGDLTHQCIQTNLADVICGGNPNDKILYPRSSKRRSASFPTPRSLERRHSLRLFGSSKRLQRCSSTRSLSKNYAQTCINTDSSSSEYHSTDSSSPKKASLLSRLFRRSGRSKQRQIETFSAQFPPAEWFNSKAVHLHSVGTQTSEHDVPVAHTLSNSTFYDGSEMSQRSLTLPRRHRRHLSSDSTFVISSRDCSPIRRGSPCYYNESLPRSTHSIPATSSSTPSTHTQRTIPSKHLNDEHNRMAAKSTEIYNSNATRKHSLGENNKITLHTDNGRLYRSTNSGPSSLESGKASSIHFNSGPSSLDSTGKISYSRTSGHSSFESHVSTSTVTTMQSPSRSTILSASPKCSPKHTYSNGNNNNNNGSCKSKLLANDTLINRVKNSSANLITLTSPRRKVSDEQPVLGKPPKSNSNTNNNNNNCSIPTSNSNSSITLQVTTSNESCMPSTKIFVQNSPVRSVITLENGKLTDKSNVFIINNETTTNGKGEFIKKTISKNGSVLTTSKKTVQDNECAESMYSEAELLSENCDTLSLISETSPDTSFPRSDALFSATCTPTTSSTTTITSANAQELLSVENSKFTKNINNDATMNNSRKLSLQIPTSQLQNPITGIVYKNLLKEISDTSNSPTSPVSNKNIFTMDTPINHHRASHPSAHNPHNYNHQHSVYIDNNNYERFAGSAGNLRFFEKNEKRINSNCDLKNLPIESPTIAATSPSFTAPRLIAKLNSNPTINTDSISHILQKNSSSALLTTVGSEPNLVINNSDSKHVNSKAISDKDTMINRRFSMSINNKDKDSSANTSQCEEMFNFPSLTDLSFNFTSLAAQKILQGVSINSIDTLVELNLAQEKQQNNLPTTVSPPSVCTDYGLV